MVLTSLLLTLAGSISGAPEDGEALLRRMNEAHSASWFTEMVFVQRTTYPGTNRPEETWYESMIRPGYLRIDIERGGKLAAGMIFRNDTLHQFADGVIQRSQPLIHHLLILLHDIHVGSPDGSIAKLRGLGFDLSKTHQSEWKERTVIVVGANEGDTTSAQFWVDAEDLVVVRVVRGGGGGLSDTHIGGFTHEGDALVERDILFYTNGTLGLREEYTWLRTGGPINPEIFQVDHLAPPAWIDEYRASKE